MVDPKAHERMARGARARELVEGPTFREIVQTVDEWYKRAVFTTKPEEAGKREALYMEYQGFRRLIGRLNDWEFDGEMAEQELAVEERKSNVR